jgi:hypothetical protein
MAEKENKSKGKASENTKPAKPVGPSLVAKERPDGTTTLAVKGGGRAGRIFLLNEKDELVQCLNGEAFKSAFNNEKVARSKRSMGDGKVQYMTSHVRFQLSGADEAARKVELEKVTSEVVMNYKEVAKLIQSGELKAAKAKTKVTIVSLL